MDIKPNTNIKDLTLNDTQQQIIKTIDNGDEKLDAYEISVFNQVEEILKGCKNKPKTAVWELCNYWNNATQDVKDCIKNLKGLFAQIIHSTKAGDTALTDSEYSDMAETISVITGTDITAEDLATLPEQEPDETITQTSSKDKSVTPTVPENKDESTNTSTESESAITSDSQVNTDSSSYDTSSSGISDTGTTETGDTGSIDTSMDVEQTPTEETPPATADLASMSMEELQTEKTSRSSAVEAKQKAVTNVFNGNNPKIKAAKEAEDKAKAAYEKTLGEDAYFQTEEGKTLKASIEENNKNISDCENNIETQSKTIEESNEAIAIFDKDISSKQTSLRALQADLLRWNNIYPKEDETDLATQKATMIANLKTEIAKEKSELTSLEARKALTETVLQNAQTAKEQANTQLGDLEKTKKLLDDQVMKNASAETKAALEAFNKARQNTKSTKTSEENAARKELKTAQDALKEVDDAIAKKEEEKLREDLGEQGVQDCQNEAYIQQMQEKLPYSLKYQPAYSIPMDTTAPTNPTVLNLNLDNNTTTQNTNYVNLRFPSLDPDVTEAKQNIGKWLNDRTQS